MRPTLTALGMLSLLVSPLYSNCPDCYSDYSPPITTTVVSIYIDTATLGTNGVVPQNIQDAVEQAITKWSLATGSSGSHIPYVLQTTSTASPAQIKIQLDNTLGATITSGGTAATTQMTR